MEDMEKMILQALDKQIDGFICPNQSEFYNCNINSVFKAIYSLAGKGILRRRNCEGLAYEYNK